MRKITTKAQKVADVLSGAIIRKPSDLSFFQDGKKKVHYIIAIKQSTLKREYGDISIYMQSLEEVGLENEIVMSRVSTYYLPTYFFMIYTFLY